MNSLGKRWTIVWGEITKMSKSPLHDTKRERTAMFRSLGANIWDHEMPIRFGGIPLWHRMTVIRLPRGGLLVHSPTRLDLASQEEFQVLGPIVAIVAPSWWHDLYLREYLNTYPDARLYGAPTLVRWNRSPWFEKSTQAVNMPAMGVTGL
jgi:hypothetical protein